MSGIPPCGACSSLSAKRALRIAYPAISLNSAVEKSCTQAKPAEETTPFAFERPNATKPTHALSSLPGRGTFARSFLVDLFALSVPLEGLDGMPPSRPLHHQNDAIPPQDFFPRRSFRELAYMDGVRHHRDLWAQVDALHDAYRANPPTCGSEQDQELEGGILVDQEPGYPIAALSPLPDLNDWIQAFQATAGVLCTFSQQQENRIVAGLTVACPSRHCSGVLIARNLFLTAEHCLTGEFVTQRPAARGGGQRTRVAFQYVWTPGAPAPVFSSNNTFPVVGNANGFASPGGSGILLNGSEDTNDFAVLILGPNAGGLFPGDIFGWVQLRNWGVRDGNVLGMLHHPGGWTKRFSEVRVTDASAWCYPWPVPAANPVEACFSGDFSGTAGSSGAPVLDEDGCLKGVFKGRWLGNWDIVGGRAVKARYVFRNTFIPAIVERDAPNAARSRPGLVAFPTPSASGNSASDPPTVINHSEQIIYRFGGNVSNVLHLHRLRGHGFHSEWFHQDLSVKGSLVSAAGDFVAWREPHSGRAFLAYTEQWTGYVYIYSSEDGYAWRLDAAANLLNAPAGRVNALPSNDLIAGWHITSDEIRLVFWFPEISVCFADFAREGGDGMYTLARAPQVLGNLDRLSVDRPLPADRWSCAATWTGTYSVTIAPRNDPQNHPDRRGMRELACFYQEGRALPIGGGAQIKRMNVRMVAFADRSPFFRLSATVIPRLYLGPQEQPQADTPALAVLTELSVGLSFFDQASKSWTPIPFVLFENLAGVGETLVAGPGVTIVANPAGWSTFDQHRSSVDVAFVTRRADGRHALNVVRHPGPRGNRFQMVLDKTNAPAAFTYGSLPGRIAYVTVGFRVRSLVDHQGDGQWEEELVSGRSGMPIGWTYTPALEDPRPLDFLRPHRV